VDLFPPALKAYHNRIFVGSALGCDCGFSFCMHIETLLLTISVKVEPVALLLAVFNSVGPFFSPGWKCRARYRDSSVFNFPPPKSFTTSFYCTSCAEYHIRCLNSRRSLILCVSSRTHKAITVPKAPNRAVPTEHAEYYDMYISYSISAGKTFFSSGSIGRTFPYCSNSYRMFPGVSYTA
jgi:hypothetical protein